MAEYIERQAAIENAVGRINLTTLNDEPYSLEDKRAFVEAIFSPIPAADVAPVRHGRWQITDCYPHNVYCSECHRRFAQTHWAVWEDGSLPREYCPNCGARMDGET